MIPLILSAALSLPISCAANPTTATLTVSDNYGAAGTVLFTSGGQGNKLWGESKPAKRTLKRLQRKGYKTVQVQWNSGWLKGAKFEGQKALGCRYAEVAEWVRNNVHNSGAFCATGNSAGGAQIAYAMTYYDTKFDAVVFSGGPPFARIDYICLDSPDTAKSTRRNIDKSYGFRRGPCSKRDETFRPFFAEDGLITSTGNYDFTTSIWFVFGDRDRTQAPSMGMEFYNRITAPKGVTVLSGVGHGVHKTRKGAREIYKLLVRKCK